MATSHGNGYGNDPWQQPWERAMAATMATTSAWQLKSSRTEFGQQMRSGELLTYLFLNRLLNGLLSYSEPEWNGMVAIWNSSVNL